MEKTGANRAGKDRHMAIERTPKQHITLRLPAWACNAFTFEAARLDGESMTTLMQGALSNIAAGLMDKHFTQAAKGNKR